MTFLKIKMVNLEKFFYILFCVSSFLFFSLFLFLKRGYIFGAALSLVSVFFYLIFLRKNIVFKIDSDIKKISLYFLLVGLFMSCSFGDDFYFEVNDYFLKYVVGAFVILGAALITISPRILFYSLASGCVTAIAIALYQYPVLDRVEGFTNAIRFGNIAMLMAICCWVALFFNHLKRIDFPILVACGFFGFFASMFSLSRGGWLLLLILPVLLYFLAEKLNFDKKIKIFFGLGLIALFSLMMSLPVVQDRFLKAKEEVVGYFDNPNKYVQTSVGARLEQWKLAWDLGWDKPWFGWGVSGAEIGKAQYIELEKTSPHMEKVNHSHNEFLEMWSTKGIFGVVFLVLFYSFPVWIFWPDKNKVMRFSEANRRAYIILTTLGLLIPVSYFIFGWTDVFFTLTIGHNFFIFSIIFIMAAIQWLKKNDRCYLKEAS